MEYDIISVLAFANANIPLFAERYEISITKPEDLIGKKVISIRSGFSSEGGQVMIVESINGDNVYLIPCEESINIHEGHTGWGCRVNEICNSVIFYKK